MTGPCSFGPHGDSYGRSGIARIGPAGTPANRDIEQRHPGELCAVAAGDYIRKPDATVRAIGYRATMLGEPWTKEDQLDDAVFRAIAEVPMEWMGRETGRQGLPFDFEDFMRRVRGK